MLLFRRNDEARSVTPISNVLRNRHEKNLRNSGAVKITKTTRKKWKQTTRVALEPLSKANTIRALMAPGLVPR